MIVTGGVDAKNTVSVYNMEGWQQDLPSLNSGRSRHACSSYWSGERRVRDNMRENENNYLRNMILFV